VTHEFVYKLFVSGAVLGEAEVEEELGGDAVVLVLLQQLL
jgi:hypothetical protein